jgi:hypothetical protein
MLSNVSIFSRIFLFDKLGIVIYFECNYLRLFKIIPMKYPGKEIRKIKGRFVMIRKGFILILCLGFVVAGCPKKTVMKEELSTS